jgi:hypothetical protein
MCLNKTYNKVCVRKCLSDTFSIQNGMMQEGALMPSVYNFPLEYTFRKVQEIHEGLQLDVCPGNVNVLGESVYT